MPPAPAVGAIPGTEAAVARLVGEARFLTRAVLADSDSDQLDIVRLEASVHESAQVWTPAIHTASRFELVTLLMSADDAISEVTVSLEAWSAGRSTVLVEWRASGRFTAPAFLDDDRLVEPTGDVVRVAGATSTTFVERRAIEMRCYYDQLSLLRQMGIPLR